MDKKIKELGSFFKGIDVMSETSEDGALTDFKILKINIPYGWETFEKKTDDFEISPSLSLQASGGWQCDLYGSGSVEYSDLFDFAQHIIKYNTEKQDKATLLQLKCQELVDLFDKTELVKLKELKFVFKGPSKNETKTESNEEVNL
jgi:hypothetical protein